MNMYENMNALERPEHNNGHDDRKSAKAELFADIASKNCCVDWSYDDEDVHNDLKIFVDVTASPEKLASLEYFVECSNLCRTLMASLFTSTIDTLPSVNLAGKLLGFPKNLDALLREKGLFPLDLPVFDGRRLRSVGTNPTSYVYCSDERHDLRVTHTGQGTGVVAVLENDTDDTKPFDREDATHFDAVVPAVAASYFQTMKSAGLCVRKLRRQVDEARRLEDRNAEIIAENDLLVIERGIFFLEGDMKLVERRVREAVEIFDTNTANEAKLRLPTMIEAFNAHQMAQEATGKAQEAETPLPAPLPLAEDESGSDGSQSGSSGTKTTMIPKIRFDVSKIRSRSKSIDVAAPVETRQDDDQIHHDEPDAETVASEIDEYGAPAFDDEDDNIPPPPPTAH